jgi:hypothetical protein
VPSCTWSFLIPKGQEEQSGARGVSVSEKVDSPDDPLQPSETVVQSLNDPGEPLTIIIRSSPAPASVLPNKSPAKRRQCYMGLPSLSTQRPISSLLGWVLSMTLRAVCAPATGKPVGSSKPT